MREGTKEGNWGRREREREGEREREEKRQNVNDC